MNKFYPKEFILRALSTIILAPLVLFIIYKGGYPFIILLSFVAFAMLFEWLKLISNSTNKITWLLIGLFYIFLPITSIFFIRVQSDGYMLLLFLLLCVWTTDTGAYIFGNLLGGPKLAPKISPKKTWSGFIGGAFCSLGVAYVFMQFSLLNLSNLILLNIVISLSAQIGDLIESALKRHFKVKDTSNIIPGHGGILDRVDSLVTAAPLFAAILLL